MRINHNLASINTLNQLQRNTSSTQSSLEKLSSGLRINRASDDAAGLAISEKMRGQIRGLEQSSRNAQDAISLIQTAEGGMSEIHSLLHRMRELAVQAANDTNTETDRGEIQKEVDQLTSEINRVSNTTEFNTKTLLDSSVSGSNGLTMQIGANGGQTFTITISDMRAVALGVAASGAGDLNQTSLSGLTANFTVASGVYLENGTSATTRGLDLLTSSNATAAIDVIDDAIKTVSSERSKLGSYQNRLDHVISNLNNSAENLTAAESRVRDVDMAHEMMEFTKNNILSQAAQAMLAQANQQPQAVLQLLK